MPIPVSASARARRRLRSIPATLSFSTTTVPYSLASAVVSLWSASRRTFAARTYVRASCLRVRARRLEFGPRRASSRLSLRSFGSSCSRARGLGMGDAPVDRTAKWRIPTSTPTTLVLPLPAGTAHWTSTVKDTNQRSAWRLMVAARMRAVPCSRRRASFLVDSWVLITPMRGSWICLRSLRTFSGPVVNRQASRTRPFLLSRENPAGRPLRRPALESAQFLRDLASPSNPEEYASLEFSAHQGATSCLT